MIAITKHALLFIITAYYTTIPTVRSKSLIILPKSHNDNTYCHYYKLGDALPPADSVVMNSTNGSIFFHETSCRGGLNSRQACSVESAARAHPRRQIYVLFSSSVSDTNLKRTCLAKLKQFDNVQFARIHLNEYARGTPLENFVNSGALGQSEWQVEHTSDVLRYLTLYKWGGVYLDTDMMVVKPFNDLGGNWVGKESNTFVNAAAIAFSKDELGRKIAKMAVDELRNTFEPDIWTNNGPGVITRVLEKTCATKNVVQWSAATCAGFRVYQRQYFYPVHCDFRQQYFDSGKLANADKAYTYHLWNKFTEDFPIAANSVYAKVAKKYCPSIFKLFGSNFGE